MKTNPYKAQSGKLQTRGELQLVNVWQEGYDAALADLQVYTPRTPGDGPPLRWTQFETETLQRLRDARACLAKVCGLASADKMTTWSTRAADLATAVQSLTNEIESNTERLIREMCR
jgi:hypothetical protein